MKEKDKKRKSDEWDLRERHWNREVRNLTPGGYKPSQRKIRKVDPRRRFKLMLVSLAIFAASSSLLGYTIFESYPSFQSALSMFSTVLSGGVFAGKYGKDIVGSIVFSISKSSLK